MKKGHVKEGGKQPYYPAGLGPTGENPPLVEKNEAMRMEKAKER